MSGVQRGERGGRERESERALLYRLLYVTALAAERGHGQARGRGDGARGRGAEREHTRVWGRRKSRESGNREC